MKKRRYYSDKKRNTKWTEQPQGRKIDFADKYIEEGAGSDKFDSRRPKKRKKLFTRDRASLVLKNSIIFACCFTLVCVGYAVMDVYMELNSMPAVQEEQDEGLSFRELSLIIKGEKVQSLSLDGSVMLAAVIDESQQNGYESVVFDAKRSDGTVGYDSSLATVGAYGAVSSASADLAKSVTVCTENDVIPVARISCYKDNIAPAMDMSMALKDGKKAYRDSQGYTYLNPDSDAAYVYIKSMVDELIGRGVRVFLLTDYDLPEEIADDYYDGFDAISKRLYVDFSDDIKILREEDITLDADSTAELKEQLEKAKVAQNGKSLYYINTQQPERVKAILDKKGITDYVINSL